MKVKINYQERKNKGDCWNIALALFTGKSYETIREHFKHFISEDDGGVYDKAIMGYCRENYSVFDTRLSLLDSLRLYNNSKGIIFLMEDEEGSHALYVKNNVLYDNIEERNLYKYITNFTVNNIIINHEVIE